MRENGSRRWHGNRRQAVFAHIVVAHKRADGGDSCDPSREFVKQREDCQLC